MRNQSKIAPSFDPLSRNAEMLTGLSVAVGPGSNTVKKHIVSKSTLCRKAVTHAKSHAQMMDYVLQLMNLVLRMMLFALKQWESHLAP